MRKSKYRQNTMVKRKKDKKKNNDLENITQKTDDSTTRTRARVFQKSK
jgi:hypothetical protein